MRFIADEHIPPTFVQAIRGEGYDVANINETMGLGVDDRGILEYATEHSRVILSETTDFRGADPDLDIDSHLGILACDTAAKLGSIVSAVR